MYNSTRFETYVVEWLYPRKLLLLLYLSLRITLNFKTMTILSAASMVTQSVVTESRTLPSRTDSTSFTSQPTQVVNSSTSPSEGFSKGAVGGIIGGVMGLLLVFAAFVYWRTRNLTGAHRIPVQSNTQILENKLPGEQIGA